MVMYTRMTIAHPKCAQGRAALLQALTNSRQPAQTPALAQHIARCPDCQKFRDSVLGQLLPGTSTPTDHCERCQSDLATYVDMTLDEGDHTTALAYPHVWWHLWTCPDCAKIFAQTVALACAERTGDIPSLPIGQPWHRNAG
jgi:hypothetical protein